MRRRAFLVSSLAVAACATGERDLGLTGATVRCAVIAGMMITDFFPRVARAFTKATGNKVEIVLSGNRKMLEPALEKGEADFTTMHACDTIEDLVANGDLLDPEPWARNEMVIVGPKDDPAGVRGMTDGAAALTKIADAKQAFVVHHANGANEVLREVLAAGGKLDEARTVKLSKDDNQESVLEIAAQKHAYSLVGYIPFKTGKMRGEGMEIVVRGDPRMTRAYVAAVVNPKKWPTTNYQAARALQAFLTRASTQRRIPELGSDPFGGDSPFAPYAIEAG